MGGYRLGLVSFDQLHKGSRLSSGCQTVAGGQLPSAQSRQQQQAVTLEHLPAVPLWDPHVTPSSDAAVRGMVACIFEMQADSAHVTPITPM